MKGSTTCAASKKTSADQPESLSIGPTLKLQRPCACGGNKAPGFSGECEDCRKKNPLGLQAKLKIGASNDPYEQEADRVADAVLGDVPRPIPMRLTRVFSEGMGLAERPKSVEAVVGSPGRSLDAATRAKFEKRYGHDFSSVRIHDDNLADTSVRSLSARAFTAGPHIAFAAGSYAPTTHEGQHLLAHELAHVVQQQASTVTVQRSEDPALDADEKSAEAKLQAAPETQISFDELEAREPRAASEIRKLSAGYRGLINQVDIRLVAAKVYQLPMPESRLLHVAHPRILQAEAEIMRDGLHDAVHLSEWLEAVTSALGHLAPLLKAWAEVRPSEAKLADAAEFTRAGLAKTAQQLAASDFMQRGVLERERKAAATREQKLILGAVDYARSMVARVWRPDMSDMEGRMYGTLLANHLVHKLKFVSAQVREVLDTLGAEDPELLKAALFGGGTVLALTDEHHRISGLQAYRADGEGFFSGAIRADRESRYANKPGQRRFSLVERAIAAAGFIAGAFQGVGDSIISNVKGIIELFTPSFWSGLVDFFRNFLPRFIDSDDFRFELGQMMGQFSTDEERRLATVDPAEYGRTFGQVFGMALTEIVLSFIGLGFVLKAFNGSARLQKIAKPLVAIANRLAKTAIASKVIRFAHVVGEAINALSLRLRKLSMLLPDLTPNARLRRTLFEIEEAERNLQKSVQRAQELEQVARKALEAGDNESAQQRVQELAQAVDDVERQVGAGGNALSREVRGAQEARQAVDTAEKVLAKEPLSDGHHIEVTAQKGICVCSPPPCPVMRKRFARQLEENPQLAKRLDAAEALRAQKPEQAAQEAENVYEELKRLRRMETLRDKYRHNPEKLYKDFKHEIADDPALEEAIDEAMRTYQREKEVSDGELDDLLERLLEAREAAGYGRPAKLDPYFKDMDRLAERARKGKGVGDEIEQARADLARGVQERMPEGSNVRVVNTERTGAGQAQGRAASRGSNLPDPDVDYVIDLPDELRAQAGLARRDPRNPNTGVFKPDDIRFSGKKHEKFMFMDHKEVMGKWEESIYASEDGRKLLKKMIERDARIAQGMGPNCQGFGYTTNDEKLAELIDSLIMSAGNKSLQRVTRVTR